MEIWLVVGFHKESEKIMTLIKRIVGRALFDIFEQVGQDTTSRYGGIGEV